MSKIATGLLAGMTLLASISRPAAGETAIQRQRAAAEAEVEAAKRALSLAQHQMEEQQRHIIDQLDLQKQRLDQQVLDQKYRQEQQLAHELDRRRQQLAEQRDRLDALMRCLNQGILKDGIQRPQNCD